MLYEEALAAFRRTLGDEHPETLTSINNLGTLWQVKGDYTGAEPLYEEALPAKRRTLGDDHPSTLGSISNLASFRCTKGDYQKALPLITEAVDGSQRVLGDAHPDTRNRMQGLATISSFLRVRVEILVNGESIEATLGVREEEKSVEYRGECVVTAPQQAEAELINAGALSGVVAIAHRGVSTFSDKAKRVAAAGAIALIIINSDDEHMEPGLDDGLCQIPVLMVRSRDAGALALATELTLTIEIPDQSPTEGGASD